MTDVSKIVFLWCHISTCDINSARYMTAWGSDAWNFGTFLVDYGFKYVDMEGGYHGPSYILDCSDDYPISDSI